MLSMEMTCPSETLAGPLINSQFLWANFKAGLCIYGTEPPMTLVALGPLFGSQTPLKVLGKP